MRVRHVFALLLVAGVCLAILEVGSYAYLRAFRGYDGVHLLNYEFDPYKNLRLAPNFHDTRGVHHNAQGFRRNEDTPTAKPAGTLRVFLMGASTAYGLESLSKFGSEQYSLIRNDETIDYFLERYLAEALPASRVEVINAAVTSFLSHHHLIYLNEKILKFDPDMVIFLDGFNDYFQFTKGYDQFRDYAYQERAHGMLGEPTLRAWFYYTGWWLFRKSHSANLIGRAGRNLWYALGTPRERGSIDVDQALLNLRENAEKNFVRMIERNGLVLRHEGVTGVFALQPEIAFEQQKTFSPLEQLIYDEMANHWLVNYIEFKNRARPIVLEYMNAAAAESGAMVLDLTDIYGAISEDIFTDYCHLTPLGNRILAEYVGERILPALQARGTDANGRPSAAMIGPH
jgi:hypothetical protein